jgi:protein TonB
MSHELFGSLTTPPARRRSGIGLISLALHTLVVVACVVGPIIANDVLPAPRDVMRAWLVSAPVVPPGPPPPPPPRTEPVRVTSSAGPTVPLAAPTGIGRETGLETPANVPVETTASTIVEGIPGGLPTVAEPPPPPPVVVAPRRTGGIIREPVKIKHVAPVYPKMALDARVEGLVIIEAIISTTGEVQEAHVLKSNALLDEAALAAVRQWRFTPSLLNGVPIPVICTVTVQFKLR